MSKKTKRSMTDALKDGDYATVTEWSAPARIAHLLDWGAKNFPKEYIPYNHVLRAILGQRALPRLDSPDVEKMRGKMPRVRAILQDVYHREMDSQPGVGVRATSDDADVLVVSLPKRVSRLRTAKAALSNTFQLIDPTKIPNTADMAPWKKWLNTSVKDVMKTLNSAEFENKLIAPSSDDSQE